MEKIDMLNILTLEINKVYETNVYYTKEEVLKIHQNLFSFIINNLEENGKIGIIQNDSFILLKEYYNNLPILVDNVYEENEKSLQVCLEKLVYDDEGKLLKEISFYDESKSEENIIRVNVKITIDYEQQGIIIPENIDYNSLSDMFAETLKFFRSSKDYAIIKMEVS